MCAYLGSLVDRLANVPGLLALLLAVLAVGFLLARLRPVDLAPLDGQPFYPLSRIATLEDFQGDERRIYAAKELTLDIAFPVAYGLFGAALLTLLLQGVADARPWLFAMRWLPLAMAGFDVVENLGIASLLILRTTKLPVLPVVTWLASAGKWLFFYASLAALLAAVVARLVVGGRAAD